MKSFIAAAALAIALLVSCSKNSPSTWKDGKEKAVSALIERVTPGYSSSFIIRLSDGEGPQKFSYSTENGKILLEGNTTISLCVAYYQYLRKWCNVNLSFCGSHIELPETLPLPSKTEGTLNGEYRSFFNYCSFSYTAAWWDWEDWQWTIDFLAMNGINMPLQVTGLEGTSLQEGATSSPSPGRAEVQTLLKRAQLWPAEMFPEVLAGRLAGKLLFGV